MSVEIPKIPDEEFGHDMGASGKPVWIQPVDTDGNKLKPIIRCNCGMWCGIGLHHVHSDGTVTASFYHKRGTNYAIGESPDGCEWHVFLKLRDYDGGDFPPAT